MGRRIIFEMCFQHLKGLPCLAMMSGQTPTQPEIKLGQGSDRFHPKPIEGHMAAALPGNDLDGSPAPQGLVDVFEEKTIGRLQPGDLELEKVGRQTFDPGRDLLTDHRLVRAFPFQARSLSPSHALFPIGQRLVDLSRCGADLDGIRALIEGQGQTFTAR